MVWDCEARKSAEVRLDMRLGVVLLRCVLWLLHLSWAFGEHLVLGRWRWFLVGVLHVDVLEVEELLDVVLWVAGLDCSKTLWVEVAHGWDLAGAEDV